MILCQARKILTTLLLLSLLSRYENFGQESIGGVVNRYAKVSSIAAGYVMVSPAEADQFAAGDYVLLIQMQGVGIQTTQGSYGVNVQTVIGTPGGYEFLRVLSVNTGTGRIDFTRNTYINSYNVTGNLQLVNVPFYNDPTVTATISGQPWNPSTGTGGIIAMFAGKKLTLNADIDASFQGFAGASGVDGIGECVFNNVSANNHDSYPLSWNNAGLKGEGVAIHDFTGVLLYPNHAKGQGRNLTGGGGGNGWFSGGGGGSNRGKGADGGLEKFVSGLCGNDPHDGGFGGINIIGTIIQDGLFNGGGGGASTQASGSSASAGGNGGGIVIIIADSIDSRNHYIRSNGNNAANALLDAGAGGGGAGGSVALSFRGLVSQVMISSNGGNGGVNSGGFGEGGGGGGGLIWMSPASLPPLVASASVANGTPAPTVPAEGIGEVKYNFIPKLNGFLFNSIHSAASGTKTDSVCSNTMFGQLVGTVPVGGTPPYTYQWERSITSATAGFAAAPGVNSLQNYTPPALLTQTTWFRRVVRDNGAAVTDISLPVMVIVHPYIKNNVIGNPDTLCYGQNAQTLIPVMTIQDGNGKYSYSWASSTDNSVFTDVSANTPDYQPAAPLTLTTWYRRTVHSGSCVDVSGTVRINVLDTIRNNSILTLPQEICQGMTFANITATAAPSLSGGDNTYRYRWESSSDALAWVSASGTNSLVNYDPVETAPYFPGQQYFRRVVMSGSNDACLNFSSPVNLNSYPVITNNVLTPDTQTTCSGSVPLQLTGSAPLNGKGPGSYTYTWQDSTKNHIWTNIPGYVNIPDQNFQPPSLTDSIRYRRIVNSSACSDISRSVRINVHKPVGNNTVSLLSGTSGDTTICTGATPNRLTGTVATGGTDIPGDYFYQWSSSLNNSSWTDIQSGATGREYQPPALTSTTYFRRRATSGQCSSESLPVRVNVLPLISNNSIAGNQTVCKSDIPRPLTQYDGTTLSGGSGSYSFLWEESRDGLAWAPAQGTNNLSDGTYQPPAMTRTMQYRRNVKSGASGCCSSISNNVELLFDSLPPTASINAGPDTSVYSFDYIVQMTADPPFEGASGLWSVISGSGDFNDPADSNTKVSNLSKGSNMLLWTVTKGACKMEDEVEIIIYDLFIPEGFSPNNDPGGFNNTFVIKGLDLPNQTAELEIINGAGSVVFSTDNRDGNEWTDWDGKNMKGADMPEATYYYLLTITSRGNNKVFKKSGFIILKRY